MIDLKALREASERATQANTAWADYWASIPCGGSDSSVWRKLQIERLAANKAYSELKEALTRALLSGEWPEEAVKRAARAAAVEHGNGADAAYLAGAGPAVEYWNRVARAALHAAVGGDDAK